MLRRSSPDSHGKSPSKVRTMNRKSHSRHRPQVPQNEPVPLTRRREFRVIAGVAVAFALVAAVILFSDRSLWIEPERLVTVYRVHGCRCAFQWSHELEREGFTVVMHEIDSLRSIRQRLRTPPEARGCHVGAFLGYFVEGHVNPLALRELSRRRPAALGLATEASTKPESQHADLASEARSRVLLIERNGESALWFQPSSSAEEGA